ncbi:hypothetical protein MKW92_027278 [Papaver armeniacum]|nr:hypothetical protein MKW92_027278 [Papaver armeniacum]
MNLLITYGQYAEINQCDSVLHLYYLFLNLNKRKELHIPPLPLCNASTTYLRLPSHIVGESEVEASKEGRRLTDFKYACVGYSVHMDGKDKDPSMNLDAGERNPSTPQGKHSELPFCFGLRLEFFHFFMCFLLVDERPAAATAGHAPGHVPGRASAYAPAHARKTEAQPSKPLQPAAEEFLPRQLFLSFNVYLVVGLLIIADIVTSGVLKNVYRVGNYINANVDDMMYPYRRRPK